MDGVVKIMKQVAAQEARHILTTELGEVTAVFPHAADSDTDNYQCSVKLKNKKLPDGSDFELRKVPVATPYLGFAAIPNVGDLVLVQFIGGNINAPVITARLYTDEDRPPVNKANEFLVQHKKDAGGSIKLDENGKVVVTSKDLKSIVTVEDQKISIATEKCKIIIDASGQKIQLESQGDIEVKSQGNVKVEATGNVEVKGAMINLGDAGNFCNDLPACLFTGAPHAAQNKKVKC